MTEAGTLKVIRQNLTALFQSFFTSRGPDYLKPGEGGSLLVLSKMVDVVIVSGPENITYY